jgi:hypothetical protein
MTRWSACFRTDEIIAAKDIDDIRRAVAAPSD